MVSQRSSSVAPGRRRITEAFLYQGDGANTSTMPVSSSSMKKPAPCFSDRPVRTLPHTIEIPLCGISAMKTVPSGLLLKVRGCASDVTSRSSSSFEALAEGV